MADESPARITRVVLTNYKSIVHCDVELRPLTILVGPNGSGKSNFVDALRFVQEALTVGLGQAIHNRGNALHILSEARPAGSDSFEITIDFQLADGSEGRFGFEIQVTPDSESQVVGEVLQRGGVAASLGPELYAINRDGGSIRASHDFLGQDRRYRRDRLFLVAYSDTPEARPVYDLLTSMAFYDPIPAMMRDIQPHEAATRLRPAGENIASMLRRIHGAEVEALEPVTAYLSRILPSLKEIRAEDLGGYDLLSLRQAIRNESGWWDARPDQISDGTLRALGVLVALFQGRMGGKSQTSLVGIEEPEAGVHPAAASILLSAMQDASYTTQVLATTHSADMLHMGETDLDDLLAVSAQNGVTAIGPIDEVSRSVVRDHLFTIGELLQMDQIRPHGVRADALTAPLLEQSIGR
jgi:predicted ATPase